MRRSFSLHTRVHTRAISTVQPRPGKISVIIILERMADSAGGWELMSALAMERPDPRSAPQLLLGLGSSAALRFKQRRKFLRSLLARL